MPINRRKQLAPKTINGNRNKLIFRGLLLVSIHHRDGARVP